jgi:ABC-2 type transport system ATP-binding protein
MVVGVDSIPVAAGAGSAVRLAARTRNLRKVYGRTVAVDHVDLDAPVGSGKTTTIRMLLGVVTSTAGRFGRVVVRAMGGWLA